MLPAAVLPALALALARATVVPISRVSPMVTRHAFARMGPLPPAVNELLDPTISSKDVAPLWKEFRKCYPTEQQAVAAARRNTAVLLPFINTPDNIRFCWQVLAELGFDDAERECIQFHLKPNGSTRA